MIREVAIVPNLRSHLEDDHITVSMDLSALVWPFFAENAEDWSVVQGTRQDVGIVIDVESDDAPGQQPRQPERLNFGLLDVVPVYAS
ncbi:MAG: hypothetical protein K0S00_2786, partial [Xanthobacteraceae bacterium]|nr:hypothetical protein [Xanthobacteraceae bacterium]